MVDVTGRSFCESCIKNLVRDKHFNRDRLCPQCRVRELCIYCKDFRDKDEFLQIFLLKKKLLRERAACREHKVELRVFDVDLESRKLENEKLSEMLNQENINLIEIGKKIRNCEEEFNTLFQSSCGTLSKSQENSVENWPRADFFFPQKATYLKEETDKKKSCNSCNSEFKENMLNYLICDHYFCDMCLPNPSCPSCQHGQNYNNKLKKNVETHVDILFQKFKEQIDVFIKHFEDLAEASNTIDDGLKCLCTIWSRYSELREIKIESVREEIARWKNKLNTIQNNVCKTEGPGKPHNTILLYEYKWSFDVSDTNKYLHETFHLVKCGENVYAMAIVRDRMKFGKFSFDGNLVFLNTLTLNEEEVQAENEAKNEATDKPKNEAYFVKLNDLKLCVGKLYFPFITINWSQKVEKLVKEEKSVKKEGLRFSVKLYHPKVSHQFLYLCTGEDSYSYKNSPFERGTIRHEYFESILFVAVNDTNRQKELKIFNVNELLTSRQYVNLRKEIFF